MDWSKRIQHRYTNKAIEEWHRLSATPITRIAYLITTHCLARYLPDAGRILDAGSGPGRYAIDIAKRGYPVAMFDLVSEMLQLGQSKVAEAGISDKGCYTEDFGAGIFKNANSTKPHNAKITPLA